MINNQEVEKSKKTLEEICEKYKKDKDTRKLTIDLSNNVTNNISWDEKQNLEMDEKLKLDEDNLLFPCKTEPNSCMQSQCTTPREKHYDKDGNNLEYRELLSSMVYVNPKKPKECRQKEFCRGINKILHEFVSSKSGLSLSEFLKKRKEENKH